MKHAKENASTAVGKAESNRIDLWKEFKDCKKILPLRRQSLLMTSCAPQKGGPPSKMNALAKLLN